MVSWWRSKLLWSKSNGENEKSGKKIDSMSFFPLLLLLSEFQEETLQAALRCPSLWTVPWECVSRVRLSPVFDKVRSRKWLLVGMFESRLIAHLNEVLPREHRRKEQSISMKRRSSRTWHPKRRKYSRTYLLQCMVVRKCYKPNEEIKEKRYFSLLMLKIFISAVYTIV